MKLTMFSLSNKTKIKLTKEQQEFLCDSGTSVITEARDEYLNLPFWYRKEKNDLFTQFLPNNLPKDLLSMVKEVLINPEWISVKDRLPNYSEPVFLTKGGCVFVGIRSETDIEGEKFLMFNHHKQPKEVGNKITHWMPMNFPELHKL